jgi:hypothetical protein
MLPEMGFLLFAPEFKQDVQETVLILSILGILGILFIWIKK